MNPIELLKLISMLLVLPIAILLLLGFLFGRFREDEEAKYLPLADNAGDDEDDAGSLRLAGQGKEG